MSPWLLLLALQAPPEFETRLSFRYAALSGSMAFDEIPAVGDRVDLEEDLGMGAAIVPALSFIVPVGRDRFSIALSRAQWEGEETLSRSRRWNESLFPAGETVESRLDWFEGTLAYEREFEISGEIDVAAGVAVRYLRLEAVLESPSQGRDDDHLITFAPGVRVAAVWEVHPRLRFEGVLDVSAWGGGDYDVRGVEAEVAAAWRLTDAISLRAGWASESWRLVKDLSVERNEASLRSSGPALGLDVRW